MSLKWPWKSDPPIGPVRGIWEREAGVVMHPDRQYPTAAYREEVDSFTFGDRALRELNEENIGKAGEREDHIVYRYVSAVGLVEYLFDYMETG